MVDLFNDNELFRKVGKNRSRVTSLILSDRGSPYTSKGYDRLTFFYQMAHSVSRVEKWIDNAPIESFFRHFKLKSRV